MSVKSFRLGEVANAPNNVASRTSSSTTLQELIATIPRSYQALLGDHLTKKFRIAHKLANARSTLSTYERHQTEDSFPPLINNSLKEPKLQFAKEWLTDASGTTSTDVFHAAVRQARQQVLRAAVDLKTKEVAHLATLTKPDAAAWDAAVINVATKVAADCGGRMKVRQTGPPEMEGVPSAAVSEYNAMGGVADVYTYRCMALARAAIDRNDLQKMSKLRLKSETDAMVVDSGSAPTDSVHKLIKDELASFRKELQSQKPKTTKPQNRVGKAGQAKPKPKNKGNSKKKRTKNNGKGKVGR